MHHPLRHPDMFANLRPQPSDPLLSLIALFRSDPRPHKLDLGVGVYRNADGVTPVFKAVKDAEAVLLAEQDTKSYLGPEGDVGFLERLAPLVFGESLAASGLIGLQTPGGTGALRLAAELLGAAGGSRRVWLGMPSWPIHSGIFRQAGLNVRPVPYFEPKTQKADFDLFFGALEAADAGDVVLLHGCCHNPTGADFTGEEWRAIGELLSRRGAVPLIDLAYQGLGAGLEADSEGLREIVSHCRTVIVAQSCNKNFGLYRERTGALFIRTPMGVRELARSNLLQLARCGWSMPPDHGAAVVRTILESPELTGRWQAELEAMRARLASVRSGLADALPGLAALRRQKGLFAQLPLTPEVVEAVRREHAVYMAGSGRINVAGLNESTIPIFVRALEECAGGVLAAGAAA